MSRNATNLYKIFTRTEQAFCRQSFFLSSFLFFSFLISFIHLCNHYFTRFSCSSDFYISLSSHIRAYVLLSTTVRCLACRLLMSMQLFVCSATCIFNYIRMYVNCEVNASNDEMVLPTSSPMTNTWNHIYGKSSFSVCRRSACWTCACVYVFVIVLAMCSIKRHLQPLSLNSFCICFHSSSSSSCSFSFYFFVVVVIDVFSVSLSFLSYVCKRLLFIETEIELDRMTMKSVDVNVIYSKVFFSFFFFFSVSFSVRNLLSVYLLRFFSMPCLVVDFDAIEFVSWKCHV